MEQLCRVCGAPLTQQLVRCPKCETPHHRDCWEYNRGCAIYGCDATVFVATASPPSARPLLIGVQEPSLLRSLSGWVAGLLQPSPPPPPPAFELRDEDPALERKEVARWIGTGQPATLMHAYALFEQRHPRQSLGPAHQAQAALEMLDAGYRALGLEAADKALKTDGKYNPNALLTRRAEALELEAAMAAEALQARSECSGQGSPEELLERMQEEVLLAELSESTAYVASMFGRGWEPEAHGPLSHAYYADDALPPKGRLLTGPYELAVARDEVMKRWRANLPSRALSASKLDLSPRCEEVRRLHFSSREAVFETDRTERRLPWNEIRAIFYALLHTSNREWKSVTEVPEVGSNDRRIRPRTTTSLALTEEFEPILEVHAGEEHARLRVRKPEGGLFDYLGRRRTMSHDRNIILATKDAVRFAPGARVGHGTMGLLMEQAGAGTRFGSPAELEEYVLWFHALRPD